MSGYLVEFIQRDPSISLDAWVDAETYGKVAEATKDLGTVYLKPLYDKLEEKVPYDQIRFVLAHLKRQAK